MCYHQNLSFDFRFHKIKARTTNWLFGIISKASKNRKLALQNSDFFVALREINNLKIFEKTEVKINKKKFGMKVFLDIKFKIDIFQT